MAKNDFAAKNAKGAKTGRAGVSPVGNLSKARRERLVAEVAEIRAYLEKSAGSDTNATRLLAFAAKLEKEVCGKKYGLVFEEHRERVVADISAFGTNSLGLDLLGVAESPIRGRDKGNVEYLAWWRKPQLS